MSSVFSFLIALSLLSEISLLNAIADIDPNIPAVDAEPTIFANGKAWSDDCFTHSFDTIENDRLQAREDSCRSNYLEEPRTPPGTNSRYGTDPGPGSPASKLTNPENRSGTDPQDDEPADNPEKVPSNQQPKPSDQATPSYTPAVPGRVLFEAPHLECLKYLNGLLKYAVCDSGDRDDNVWMPLPNVWEGAPFYSLTYCTLGKFGLDFIGHWVVL